MAENKLYYGDNLDVLRRYVKDESVDLVYLDPPFNSRQDYNVLFAEKDGSKSSSQITAFEDTWEWNKESQKAYEEIVETGGRVSDVMRAFHTFLGGSDMMAYLAMMAPRLMELHRVLKMTGSIYLHCDSTASHYLKMLMDGIFSPQFFVNEIIWKRTTAHNDPGRYGRNTDVILYYSKSDVKTWNAQYGTHDESYIARFRNTDTDGRRWADDNLTAKGLSGGGYDYEYKGVRSYWRCPPETMKSLDERGRLHFTKAGGIRLKRYLDENKGPILQALWEDIPPINSQAKERLGYPTQKPELLLDRIIQASSNEGDVVLDPFCGCGTAIVTAQKLKRHWIGIDITHLAIGLIKTRLQDAFGPDTRSYYDVVGEPTDLESAKVLSEEDRFQFQAWALGLVGARTAYSDRRGADRGIDGKLFFRDSKEGELRQIILSVKSGKVQVRDVRDLIGVIDREKADIGVLITLEEPSKPMVKEAVDAGFFKSPTFDEKVSRIQILTVEQLLSGTRIAFPHMQQTTFKKAPKSKAASAKNLGLFSKEESDEGPF